MRQRASSSQLLAYAALFFALAFVAAHQARRFPNRRQTALTDFYITDSYAQDMGAVMIGARRMAANLAYIELMQYYGVYEVEDPAIEAGAYIESLSGNYPNTNIDLTFRRLQEFGFRIVRLDPLFNEAILEISGALAFNQQRLEQATDLLEEAIRRDPTFYRYRLYAAAILYKGKGQEKSLIHTLDEAIQYPDCPMVLKNILANLHKKYKHFKTAALIYVNMYETSHNDGERHQAQEGLEKLLKEHPELSTLPELRRL